MSVSYAIMAHPSRREYVDELRAVLGDVPVAWAKPPYAERGFRGPVWRTCREALRMHTDAPHHVVIQDDAIPCPGFTGKVEALCETLGDRLGMLFYRHKGRSWRDIRRVASEGHDFTMSGRLLGPAVVYPAHRIVDCIATCDAMEDRLGSDARVRRWARVRGVDTYVPIPSLVDHRAGPSLVGGSYRRRAWRVAS